MMTVAFGFAGLWALVMWLACGIFAFYVAQEKDRCAFCWFVWGAIFGPVALIAIVGVPRASQKDSHSVGSGPPAQRQEGELMRIARLEQERRKETA